MLPRLWQQQEYGDVVGHPTPDSDSRDGNHEPSAGIVIRLSAKFLSGPDKLKPKRRPL